MTDIVNQIDIILNKNVPRNILKEKETFLKIEEIEKKESFSIEDCRKKIEMYTEIINLNNKKEIAKQRGFLKKAHFIINNIIFSANKNNEEYLVKRAMCYKKIKEYAKAINDQLLLA